MVCPRFALNRALGVAIAAYLGACSIALAADVRVLCPTALRTPILETARIFARSSGHRIEFIFASVGAVHKRIATGERADVAIGTAQGTNALVRLGRGIEGSRVPLVRTALALAVGKSAGPLDVANADALAAALRRAESLVAPDAALGVPGGAQATELLDRLGIEAELRAKTRFVADAREVAKRVASGAAEIGIGAMNDLVSSADVVVLGPLAAPPTAGIAYAALVVRGAANADPARAFIAHLRAPESATIFRKAGYLPID